MDVDVPGLVLLVAYATLVLELAVFRVPSEASTYQVFAHDPAPDVDPVADALAFARTRPVWVKIASYLVPTVAGVLCFLAPPLVVLVPEVRESLLPLDALGGRGARWAGVTVLLVGRGLTLTAALQVRRRRACGLLQSEGLFRWSRNPGLVGMYLLYAGALLMTPCGVLVVGFVPYAWNMHRRVLMEESHLERTVGVSYTEYATMVPRYLGWR